MLLDACSRLLMWLIEKTATWSLLLPIWKAVYQFVYGLKKPEDDDMPFTNYGYEILLKEDGKLDNSSIDQLLQEKQKSLQQHLPKEFQRQWHSVNLYAAVLLQAERYGKGLGGGKRFLEVGCGRGGGCAVLQGLLSSLPRSTGESKYMGVDVSNEGIYHCRDIIERNRSAHFDGREIHFAAGNGMELDKIVTPGIYDVVYNVESSHCYPDFYKFLRESYKALKPGGLFLWCDLRKPHFIPQVLWSMNHAGLRTIAVVDISENVRQSLQHGALDCFESELVTYVAKVSFIKGILCHGIWGFLGKVARHSMITGQFAYSMVCCKKVSTDAELQQLRDGLHSYKDCASQKYC